MSFDMMLVIYYMHATPKRPFMKRIDQGTTVSTPGEGVPVFSFFKYKDDNCIGETKICTQ